MKNHDRAQNVLPMNEYTGMRAFNKLYVVSLALIGLAFILSRLPLINIGFGLDADAWRIAGTAFDLRHHLSYHTSRFPGYPLPELVNSLIIDHGWLATNSLTMLISLATVIIFVHILRILDFPNKRLLIVTYAFLPILWINSTNTMDYMWSLCFILLTWLFILKRKWMVAGVMFGLAMGSRPHAVVLALPFIYLCHSISFSKKDTMKFVVAAIIVALLLFLPLFWTYGLKFFKRYPARTDLMQIGYMMIRHFGLPAIVMLVIGVSLSLRNLRSIVAQHNVADIFIASAVLFAIASFAAMPYHIEYMIIFMPFILMCVYRIFSRPLLIILSMLLISHAFVTIGSFKHLGNRQLKIRLTEQGAVFRNIEARKQQLTFAHNLERAHIDEHSVVVVGPYLPVVAYLNERTSSAEDTKKLYDPNQSQAWVKDFEHDITYHYMLTPEELRKLTQRSYKIYYIEGVRELTIQTYDYDLADHETTYLDL
jgi:hypothetical protein